jgi:hypothetical protein
MIASERLYPIRLLLLLAQVVPRRYGGTRGTATVRSILALNLTNFGTKPSKTTLSDGVIGPGPFCVGGGALLPSAWQTGATQARGAETKVARVRSHMPSSRKGRRGSPCVYLTHRPRRR